MFKFFYNLILQRMLSYIIKIYFHIYFKLNNFEKSKLKSQICEKIFFISKNKKKLFEVIKETNSQLFQEIFVLVLLNFKKKGYFVEFGACDGVYCSNTLVLEKKYMWKGILAEPSIKWKNKLKINRDCNLSFNCVSNSNNSKIFFFENLDPALSSTMKSTNSIKTYKVSTININNLLKKFKAPRNIDYMSIDTEGSEFEIISSLNFKSYRPKIITCEHNFRKKDRYKIKKFLSKKNYAIFDLVNSRYDDWYYDLNYFKKLF